MNMGGRAYPVRHYPVAIRLRDREGRAILCIALSPQSGDSSGAILGVRSVALLHLIIDTFSINPQKKVPSQRSVLYVLFAIIDYWKRARLSSTSAFSSIKEIA